LNIINIAQGLHPELQKYYPSGTTLEYYYLSPERAIYNKPRVETLGNKK